MSWTADDIPDQTGRIAVITGANGGLGLETAKALAAKGAHVVMAARDQAKAGAAEREIRSHASDASLEVVALDLGDQASVKDAAAAIAEAHPTVDLLVNNAGVMAMPERRTADGYEMQLGVNHLGHWTFTAGLLAPLLRSASEGRRPSRLCTPAGAAAGAHTPTAARAYTQTKVAEETIVEPRCETSWLEKGCAVRSPK